MRHRYTPLEIVHKALGVLLVAALFGGLAYVAFTRFAAPYVTGVELLALYGRDYFVVVVILLALFGGWAETGYKGR
jgi:TctA family transporter